MQVTRLTDRIRLTLNRTEWNKLKAHAQDSLLRLAAEQLVFKSGIRRLFFHTFQWGSARKFFPQLTRSDKR